MLKSVLSFKRIRFHCAEKREINYQSSNFHFKELMRLSSKVKKWYDGVTVNNCNCIKGIHWICPHSVIWHFFWKDNLDLSPYVRTYCTIYIWHLYTHVLVLLLYRECVICGDTATHRHFGIIACNPCRKFWRANYAKKENLPTGMDCQNACVVTKETRNNCKSCRFRLCEEMGMKTPNGKPSSRY